MNICETTMPTTAAGVMEIIFKIEHASDMMDFVYNLWESTDLSWDATIDNIQFGLSYYSPNHVIEERSTFLFYEAMFMFAYNL